MYAIVFESPNDGVLRFPGLTNAVHGAEILGGGPAVACESDGQSLVVTLPESQRGNKDFVVTITLQGPPQLDAAVHAGSDGVFTLLPRDATVTHGIRVQAASSAGLDASGEENLGYWLDPRGTISWSVKSNKAESVGVTVRLAAVDASEGSQIELVCGQQVLLQTVKATGNWNRFLDVSPGSLDLPAGVSTITVRAKTVKGIAPCNIAAVKLKPAR